MVNKVWGGNWDGIVKQRSPVEEDAIWEAIGRGALPAAAPRGRAP